MPVCLDVQRHRPRNERPGVRVAEVSAPYRMSMASRHSTPTRSNKANANTLSCLLRQFGVSALEEAQADKNSNYFGDWIRASERVERDPDLFGAQLSEDRPGHIASDKSDLLLESAAFASSVAQQPPLIIPPLTLDHPRVGVIRGHGRVRIDRRSGPGKQPKSQVVAEGRATSGPRSDIQFCSITPNFLVNRASA